MASPTISHMVPEMMRSRDLRKVDNINCELVKCIYGCALHNTLGCALNRTYRYALKRTQGGAEENFRLRAEQSIKVRTRPRQRSGARLRTELAAADAYTTTAAKWCTAAERTCGSGCVHGCGTNLRQRKEAQQWNRSRLQNRSQLQNGLRLRNDSRLRNRRKGGLSHGCVLDLGID
jgi:hypothetical protein